MNMQIFFQKPFYILHSIVRSFFSVPAFQNKTWNERSLLLRYIFICQTLTVDLCIVSRFLFPFLNYQSRKWKKRKKKKKKGRPWKIREGHKLPKSLERHNVVSHRFCQFFSFDMDDPNFSKKIIEISSILSTSESL